MSRGALLGGWGSLQGAIKGQSSGLAPGQDPWQVVNECHHDSDSHLGD